MGLLFSCPHQETVDIIESCGRFSHVAYPGLNCVNPFAGQCIAGNISLKVKQLDVTVETKTKDNVFVHLTVAVQYCVDKNRAYDAYYKLTNTSSQISSYIFDVVRSSVPKLDLDDVFLEKRQIAQDVKEELSKSMGAFGFCILQALVTDITPAAKVKDAMNDINAATRLRFVAVAKAEAKKIGVIKVAEAESETKYLKGQGFARQRQAIINGLHQSVKEFEHAVPGVTSQDVLELMLVTQYFHTLKDVGANPKATTVFAPSGGKAKEGLRSGLLEAGAAEEMTR